MKKLTMFAFAVFFVATTTATAQKPDTKWYTANPEATEFTISTDNELAGLADIVNGMLESGRDNFSGKTVTLTTNINLSKYKNWEPIGNYSANDKNIFEGTFDGAGYTIGKLAINRPDKSNQGLFGATGKTKVVNLGLTNVNIIGKNDVGGVAGADRGSSIINCYTSGTITGQMGVGGIIGTKVGGNVDSCYFGGAIRGDNSLVGGVVGKMMRNGRINNCHSTGTVTGQKGSIGGIAGGITGGGVANCYSTSTINGGSGIVGRVEGNGTVSNCYSTGSISGRGGITAEIATGHVINCAALNPEVKSSAMRVGRIVGDGADNFRGYVTNNVAFTGMKNNAGNREWARKGPSDHDGDNITAEIIRTDGTIGGRFTESDGWTTKNGKLPGHRGKTVDIPAHLK